MESRQRDKLSSNEEGNQTCGCMVLFDLERWVVGTQIWRGSLSSLRAEFRSASLLDADSISPSPSLSLV